MRNHAFSICFGFNYYDKSVTVCTVIANKMYTRKLTLNEKMNLNYLNKCSTFSALTKHNCCLLPAVIDVKIRLLNISHNCLTILYVNSPVLLSFYQKTYIFQHSCSSFALIIHQEEFHALSKLGCSPNTSHLTLSTHQSIHFLTKVRSQWHHVQLHTSSPDKPCSH